MTFLSIKTWNHQWFFDNNTLADQCIFIEQPLNYEVNRQVILQIGVLNEAQFTKAVNGQTPTMCTTTVTVKIKDSDEGPECQPPVKIIQSKDGLPAGQELLGYKATDPETSSSEGIR